MTRPCGALAAMGAAQVALTLAGLRALATGHLVVFLAMVAAQGGFYFAAVRLARKRPDTAPLWLLLAFAVGLRCCVLFAPAYLSDDIYRYVWDGRVQAAGINPYRYIPSEPPLAGLRDTEIYPNINRASYAHTIYPPLAQMFFFAATRISQSVVWMKTALTLCDLFSIGALLWLLGALGLPRSHALVYAWHPLIIWEFAGNGHVDALAIALILLAICLFHRFRRAWSSAWAGAALAAAVAVKLLPLMLLPALFRRWRWTLPIAFAATLGLLYAPYLGVGWGVFGFLPSYANEEGLGSGERFYPLTIVRHALGLVGTDWGAAAYIALALLALAAITVATVRQPVDTATRIRWAAAMVCTFTVLATPRYSWYFAWSIPFLVFETFWPMLYLTVACFGLYALKLIATERAEFAINSAVYVPFYLLLLYAALRGAKRGARPDESPSKTEI